MLTITPDALDVIRRVSDHPTLKPSSGLRLGSRPDSSTRLEVRAVSRPRPGDKVVERSEGRLYLDAEAIRRTDGRELDAVTDKLGRVQFILRDAA